MSNKIDLLFNSRDVVISQSFHNTHEGVDYAPLGAKKLPLYAVGMGVVTYSAYADDVAGNVVMIYFINEGYTGYYGHLDKRSVIVGQRVETGAQIGVCGTTGYSTGVHLHFGWCEGKQSYYPNKNLFIDFESYEMKEGEFMTKQTREHQYTLVELTVDRTVYLEMDSKPLWVIPKGTRLLIPYDTVNKGVYKWEKVLIDNGNDTVDNRWINLEYSDSTGQTYRVLQDNYILRAKLQ